MTILSIGLYSTTRPFGGCWRNGSRSAAYPQGWLNAGLDMIASRDVVLAAAHSPDKGYRDRRRAATLSWIMGLSPPKCPKRMVPRHPRDSDAHAPPDDTRDPNDGHDEEYLADAAKCVLESADVGTQTIANRVADSHRVGHEEHSAKQVTHEERAEGQTQG